MTAHDRRPRGGLSHVIGDRDPPLLDLTLPALLADTTARLPDHPAAIFRAQNIRWTYGRFSDEVDRLARGLLNLGVTRGAQVGIWSPNRPEWLLTQFATARIGAILVCINPAYRLSELEYALNAVGCTALITAPAFKSSDYTRMLQTLAPELATASPGALQAARLPDLRSIIVMGDDIPPGMIGFDALCEAADHTAADLDTLTAGLDPHDVINIQFTSGSPKGASLTHHNILNNAHFVTHTLELTEHDRLCIPVPFYHCFGMVMGTLGCVTKGATIVVPGEGFDPRDTLRAVSEEGCTALFGVPTMFVNELALPDFDAYDLSTLRTGIMAGAPCPREIMETRAIADAYDRRDHRLRDDRNLARLLSEQCGRSAGSAGLLRRPHPPACGGPPGGPRGPDRSRRGTGRTAHPRLFGDAGLLGRGRQNRQQHRCEGWMHTGDLGVLDAEGYCAITGRVKDMILRGGENIYPREIEEFLYTHADIAQAQVFGIPDDALGEIVCAWLVLHEGATVTADGIRQFCKDNIAHFKVPVHIRIKADLPMTVTCKPQKFIMRDQMVAELSGTD